jgi:outer membrane protein, heavy metal efflux system
MTYSFFWNSPTHRLFILAIILLASLQGCVKKSEKEERLLTQRQILKDAYESSVSHNQVTLEQDPSLKDFLTIALLNHPKVKSAYYDWIASIENITVARSLPDMQLTLQMDIKNIVSSFMPGLMGDIPGPGKLGLRAEIATADSHCKYLLFRKVLLETAFTVKKIYYELGFAEEQLRIAQNLIDLQSAEENFSISQNNVGRSSLSRILVVQSDKDKLLSDFNNLLSYQKSLRLAWKGALGLQIADADSLIPEHFEYTLDPISPDDLFKIALQRNPQLNVMKEDLVKAKSSLRLALKNQTSDFTVGMNVGGTTETILMQPQLAMTLPFLWKEKIASEIAQAQAQKEASHHKVSDEEIRLTVEFAEKEFDFEVATHNVKLLTKSLVPKANERLKLILATNTVALSNFTEIFILKKEILELQLKKAQALKEREIALAELSLLIAGILPETTPLLKNIDTICK